MIEFSGFGKIQRIGELHMSITQKLHGSNAQIYIFETENGLDLICGSRTRWIYPGDDNYGFATFVHQNKQQFIELLGIGRHFGEWCGPGINSGEGLLTKTLFLFNWRRWKDKPLPSNVSVVPILHYGKLDLNDVDAVMEKLKIDGSRLVPGYMKPEGIVVEVSGTFYKKVFDAEEIAWKKTIKKEPKVHQTLDIEYLLQPLRLEKLISKDERYIREYPVSLPTICADYVKDLHEEQQIIGNDDEIDMIKKSLGRKIFSFVKTIMKEKYDL